MPRRASCWRAVLAGVGVETRQVERCAEALGREVAADERSVIEQTAAVPAPTLYLGLDGTGVPVRPAEVAGRRGKQPTRARPRVGQLQRRGRERGQPRHRPAAGRLRTTGLSRGNTARFRHRSPARRPWRRRRVDLEPGRRAVPGAIEIVDIYHAQHLCDVAKALYGPGTDLADRWARDRHAELDAGGSALSSPRCASMSRPRPRRERAFSTCSGTATGCAIRSSAPGVCASRRVSSRPDASKIGARLKRAGMRWTVAGANAIIALRCCIFSGRFEDFWERRAATAA